MSYVEFISEVDRGIFGVTCPDGTLRRVWGYNPNTGDVFIAGWVGDVFLNASNRQKVGVDFV